MEKWWKKYKVDIPEGKKGDWKIERFVIDKTGASRFNMSLMFQPGGYYRRVEVGTYTRLWKGRQLVMSDTPAEIRDHLEVIHKSQGRVLLNGLGLGVVLNAILKKPEVLSVTVVEISPDVVNLVGGHYLKNSNGKLNIVTDDAFVWFPPRGERFDVVWHDIWNDICADNLPQMCRLHRRYGRRCDWQGSWARELCNP